MVATPLKKDSFEMRKPLPKQWGGKTKEELLALTGIDTLYFCHKNLFTCACLNFEDATKIAELAVKNVEYKDDELGLSKIKNHHKE